MSDRTDADRLADIAGELELLAATLAGVSFEDFAAVPGVPWPRIRGLRNRIVHGYFGLDIRAIWLTATVEAPQLAREIRASNDKA